MADINDDDQRVRPYEPQHMINDPEVITSLLTTPGRWAVVGLSRNQDRAAFGVAAFLRQLGHKLIAVHPRTESVHDSPAVSELSQIEGAVDVVDVFVNSSMAGQLVDQAIAIGAGAVWLQLGVIDEAAAQRALDAGLHVVMDACPVIEAERRGLRRVV